MPKRQKRRDEIDSQYKWDLKTIYASDEEFYKEYKEVGRMIEDFNPSNVLESGEKLYNYLKSKDDIYVLIDKLYNYAHLNNDSDTTISLYDEMVKKVLNLYDEMEKKNSFFFPTLLKLDYSKIEKFYSDFPKLKDYEIMLKESFRFKNHVLGEKEEALMSELSKALRSSSETYEKLTDTDMTFGHIRDEEGKLVELTESNYSIYLQSKKRSVRRSAFKHLMKKYGEFIHAISSTYSGYVNTLNALSNIYKYENPLEEALFQDDISVSVYDSLIKTVNEHMDVIYKYYDFRNKVLGLKSHIYDTYTELISEEGPNYSFEEAEKIVLEALSVLGEDYIKVMKRAFDEHWIDVYNSKGKRGGAYSSGGYLTNPFVLLNYEGKYNDISTLAHELGHSMHSYYANSNNSYTYSGYPIFVAEIASTVNEMLLANYMLEHGDDLTKKIVINNLLGLFKATIYRQTMFAEFEKDMVLASKEGAILTSDYLCSHYLELVKKYFGSSVVVDDEVKYEWARVPHFYYHFYVYKYATGLSIASYIATEILKGNKEVLKGYREFLKIGSRMNPGEALMTIGIDITKKDVVESAIKLFDTYIEKAKVLIK